MQSLLNLSVLEMKSFLFNRISFLRQVFFLIPINQFYQKKTQSPNTKIIILVKAQ